MCFCSCLPIMTKNQRDSLNDEDNQSFDYMPSFNRVEIQRTQIKATKLNSHNDEQHLFTIFDKSLIDSNENDISTLNSSNKRQSLCSSSSSSSNQILDVASLDTLSIDSGICNSNRSSLSVEDDKQTVINLYESEVSSKATCDLKLFKANHYNNNNRKNKSLNVNCNKEQTFMYKLKENMFLRVKECISMTYLMFSTDNNNNNNNNNNNHRQNQTIPLDLLVENHNNPNTNIVRPDAVLADFKRINSLLIGSVTPLCQFFLRIYDTNFF
jgi:hypothetical protein